MRSFPGGGRSALLDSFRAGEERALARAISVVEDQAPGFEALLDELRPSVGRARRIGITGPPGAGKSTLTARFARLLRNEGNRVGIIAVDPTSPFTGGALLGDRIRMAELAVEPGLFIRSMASRGSLGGLATTTREVAIRGKTIPTGRKVMLLYASGNRDEREFGPTASECDITRRIRRHLTFSYGAHHCIGAAIARLQATIALERTQESIEVLLTRLELGGAEDPSAGFALEYLRGLPLLYLLGRWKVPIDMVGGVSGGEPRVADRAWRRWDGG